MTTAFKFGPVQGQLFGGDKNEAAKGQLIAALIATAEQIARDIKLASDSDIRAGGNFGERWTAAFTVRTRAFGGSGSTSSGVELTTFFTQPKWYGYIFEFGGVVRAKAGLFNRSGLLWIPLSFAGVPKGMGAQEYGLRFGGLFRVNRRNGKAPLLLSKKDHKPKFFGKVSVTMPKKFHLRAIGRKVMKTFNVKYAKNRRIARGVPSG